jgi:hypothetical protein
MVDVPEMLIQYSASEEVQALGSGIAFASRHVENANDLLYKDVTHVDLETKRRLLVFDAWVRNSDRTLGRLGGNVNLLWQPAEKNLRVFDHNNAFDPEFALHRYATDHVFGRDLEKKDDDFAVAIESEMNDILTAFHTFVAHLPDEWLELVADLPGFSIDLMESHVSDYRKAALLMRNPS